MKIKTKVALIYLTMQVLLLNIDVMDSRIGWITAVPMLFIAALAMAAWVIEDEDKPEKERVSHGDEIIMELERIHNEQDV